MSCGKFRLNCAKFSTFRRRRSHRRIPVLINFLLENTMERLLTARQVCETLGVSRATLYRLLNRGSLPKPLTVSLRAKRWKQSEIEQHIGGLDDGT